MRVLIYLNKFLSAKPILILLSNNFHFKSNNCFSEFSGYLDNKYLRYMYSWIMFQWIRKTFPCWGKFLTMATPRSIEFDKMLPTIHKFFKCFISQLSQTFIRSWNRSRFISRFISLVLFRKIRIMYISNPADIEGIFNGTNWKILTSKWDSRLEWTKSDKDLRSRGPRYLTPSFDPLR